MPETNFDFSVLETIPDTDAEIEVPEEVLEGPQTDEEQGVASLILDAISNSANTIQMYNAIIANCTDEEIIDSLNEILVDENRIMGKLQSILKKVSPNAEEIMNGAIEENGLEESLNLNELLSDSSFVEPSKIVIKAGGPQNYSKYRINSYIKNIINNCTFKPEILNDSENTVTVTVPGRQDWINKLYNMYEESTERNITIDLEESLNEDFVPKYFYRVMKFLYNNDYDGCDEIELEELLMNSPQFHNMSEKTAEIYVDEYLTYYRDPREFRKLKVDESLNEAADNQKLIPYHRSVGLDVFIPIIKNGNVIDERGRLHGINVHKESDGAYHATATAFAYADEDGNCHFRPSEAFIDMNGDTIILDPPVNESLNESKVMSGNQFANWYNYHDGNGYHAESLEEDKKITRYSDVLSQKDRDRGWWYFTTHGVGPGTIPKDLNVLEVRDGQNKKGTWGTFVRLDGIVNTSELSYYDLIELAPPNAKNESLNESIAIKKNSTWIDTVGNDLCKVVDIKEVEKEKRYSSGSFKDTDIIVQYDDTPRKFTFSKGEFLSRFVPFRKSYRESINEDLLYANNIDKEILDGAGDKNIRPITTGTREKCSISAINNLKALLSRGESASLCLGCMKLKNEDPDPNSWISHVWVKSENGDILETNVHNIDFNSREHYCVKEIKFEPKDFENIGYFYNKLESELGGKSVNESLLESSRENIDQFIRNYLIRHSFDSAEEMIDYLEEYGEIEELEDRFHTDVEAAIEDYFEYLNESLILDESNNLDTSLDDITPVRDEHNERAIRDHKKYKEDRKKAFKEISKNAKDAFELDESLFESFYLNYEDSDLLQDWDQGGLDFSVDIHPYKYEFYTSRDANKALKIAISHGYKDSWREGHYVYLTAH